MKKEKLSPETLVLRARAEAQLKKQPMKPMDDAEESSADSQRLLHELQVHQVELEMQNAALIQSQDEMERVLDKYTDLYDFAPIGYFSVNQRGEIQAVNLTGSALLGVERSRLINRPLSGFVEASFRHELATFWESVFTASGKTACEVKLLKSDGSTFWASLTGGSQSAQSNEQELYRIAVTDITSLKVAQEAYQRQEVLTVVNRELKNELGKRRAIANDLRKSEEKKSKLLDAAHRHQKQFRDYSHRVIQRREDERRQISRELHDEITQTLVGVNVALETLSRNAALNPSLLRKKIASTQKIVEAAVKTVHDFAFNLRPTSLDDLGLIVTLHSYLNDFLKRTSIRVRFKAFADVEKMSSTQRTTIYRIVQEALINVDKHAEAQQVEVNVQKIGDWVKLEIIDNGKSFDVLQIETRKGRKHLGLIGMQERAEMVGGEFLIQSTPGVGTKIIVRMPFKIENEESV